VAETRLLRHMVLFAFKEGTPEEKEADLVRAFRALPEKIPGILDFEWGTNVSPEKLAQGFSHCFLLSFRSEEERDRYLSHPAHRTFSAAVRPYLADVLVLDYRTDPAGSPSR